MEIGTKPLKIPLTYRLLLALGTGLLFVLLLWTFDFFSERNMYNLKGLAIQGIIYGLIFSIFFPYLFGKFALSFSKKVKIIPNLASKEIIEIEGPASLILGKERVGGKIFLTNEKMIFKSHEFNIQKGQTEIKYSEIIELLKIKMNSFFDNGIRLKTQNEKSFDFIVNERDLWVEKLKEYIPTYQEPS